MHPKTFSFSFNLSGVNLKPPPKMSEFSSIRSTNIHIYIYLPVVCSSRIIYKKSSLYLIPFSSELYYIFICCCRGAEEQKKIKEVTHFVNQIQLKGQWSGY